MPFVSELMGKPVTDYEGEYVGKLKDLLATPTGEIHHPQVIAIEIKRRSDTLIVPMSDVAVLIAPAIPLNKRITQIEPYVPGENDLFLVADVFDKQIIDTNAFAVVTMVK